MDGQAAFWIAVLLAACVPAVLARRRRKPWLPLVVLTLLPVLMVQLIAIGDAYSGWWNDSEAFRTTPQRLRYDADKYAEGTYSKARDTVTFIMPERTVVVGPPEFAWPAQLASVKLWAQGIGVGFVLVSVSFVLGLGMGRIWPPAGAPSSLAPLRRPR